MTSADTSRVWLITGSSSGFGLHIARAALERGDRVVATARRSESLDDLVASAPDRALAVALDVTRADQIDSAVAAALERFGRVDVLVNNAGYGSIGAVEELEMDDLCALMDTMFFGAVALTKAVLPHMRERGSGAIVQMSSQGGQVTFPGYGAYCAAKYALEGMSEALADEVGPLGIRVLIVEPGAFRTGLLGASMHRSREIPAYAGTAGATRRHPPLPAVRRRPRGSDRPPGRSVLDSQGRRRVVDTEGRVRRRRRSPGFRAARVRGGDGHGPAPGRADRTGRREAKGRQGRERVGRRGRPGRRRRLQQHVHDGVAPALGPHGRIPRDRPCRLVRHRRGAREAQPGPDGVPGPPARAASCLTLETVQPSAPHELDKPRRGDPIRPSRPSGGRDCEGVPSAQ